MAQYLNTVTGEYPRHDGDLELLGWVVGNPLPANWVEVQYVEPPVLEEGQTFEQEEPAQINGVWQMVWSVRDLTTQEKQEIAARQVRQKVQTGQTLSAEEAALLIG